MNYWVCPSDKDGCPGAADQQIVHNQWNLLVTKDTVWTGKIPDPSYQWNCKYVISANQTFIQQTNNSWIMLFIESNGFDGDVYIIAQLNGKFQDYTKN
jgi:hypothetical protein